MILFIAVCVRYLYSYYYSACRYAPCGYLYNVHDRLAFREAKRCHLKSNAPSRAKIRFEIQMSLDRVIWLSLAIWTFSPIAADTFSGVPLTHNVNISVSSRNYLPSVIWDPWSQHHIKISQQFSWKILTNQVLGWIALYQNIFHDSRRPPQNIMKQKVSCIETQALHRKFSLMCSLTDSPARECISVYSLVCCGSRSTFRFTNPQIMLQSTIPPLHAWC